MQWVSPNWCLGMCHVMSCHIFRPTFTYFYWLAEGWSLILAEPTRTHPAEPGRTRPRDIIFSELYWANIFLSFHWSECDENFRADPNKTNDKIQIQIKMSNPSQKPPASSKAPSEDLKDMDVLCTLKLKTESQNLHHGYIKEKWPYLNQDQDAKPQSGTSSVLQSYKWGLKKHGYSLHLQTWDREPKFGSWVYQRPVTIFKSRSRCQTPVRNL